MNRNRKKPFFITIYDGIIIAGILIVIGMLAFFIYAKEGGRLRVLILSTGDPLTVDLSAEKEIVLTGPVGETRVLIHDNKVRVVSSDCHSKICVRSGAIDEEHEWIACLPNQVLIRIEGNNNVGYDAESY